MANGQLTDAQLKTLVDDDDTPDELIADYFEFDEKTLPGGIDEAEIAALEDIPNLSTANEGKIGWFNRRRRRKLDKRFRKRADDGFNGLTMVSEGDSWFHYPVRLDDVIEHLFEDPKVNILSRAFAGDWLSNIAKEKEYLAALDWLKPEVFLVSGGGNDLVGKERLKWVLRRYEVGREADWYLGGAFDRVMEEMEELYTGLFDELTDRYPAMKIIGHGYDHPIPDGGKWLGEPMEIIGIEDAALQREIARLMINRYNDVRIALAAKYAQVSHVDCRGVVQEWHDELHPTSKSFGLVAAEFKKVIADALND